MHVLLEHTEKVWIFLKVAECGSISRAAEELHLTQPTVSYAVKTLEEQLGAQLLIRTSKGVKLNPTGKLIAAEMLKARDHLTQTEDDVFSRKGLHVPGKMVLGTYESIAVYLWPKLTLALEHLHPGIELSLITRRSRELIKDVSDGKLDAALAVGPIHADDVSRTLLYEDTYSFYGLGGQITDKAPVITVPDAADVDGKSLRTWIGQSRFRDRHILSLSSFEVCAEFAAQGLGITILPTRVYEKQASRGRMLQTIEHTGLCEGRFGRHEFYFCYRPDSPRIDGFKDYLSELIKKML